MIDPTPAEGPRKVPPEDLALRARPRPVARMSRKAVALAVGVPATALAVAAIWSLSPRSTPRAASDELYQTRSIPKADGLARLPSGYDGTVSGDGVPQLGAPLPGDLGRPILQAQRDGRLDPAPEAVRPDHDAVRQRAEALRRERDAIRRSDLLFRTSNGATSRGQVALTPTVTTPALEARTEPAEGSQAAKRAFLAGDGDTRNRIYGNTDLITPRSPYQLMAGSVIPAALVTGISSDLPGDVIATVTANVFDSVTGRHLLIPQGARLIGRYDSGVGYAQSRLLLRWERLMFPDGGSILLDNLPATDPGGRAGLKDRTDNHFDRLLGGAVLATLLGVGTELASRDRIDADGGLVVATGQGASGAAVQIGQEITRRNLDVQPTLTIRPGFPLRVMVQRDLVLRPVTTP